MNMTQLPTAAKVLLINITNIQGLELKTGSILELDLHLYTTLIFFFINLKPYRWASS